MTTLASQQELVRYLEDRFACAQACTECARACVLRVSGSDPGGSGHEAAVRRKALMCAEVCDATCGLLAEQNRQDEAALRFQAEWCRGVCLEYARLLDGRPGAERDARISRECARACETFLATLD